MDLQNPGQQLAGFAITLGIDVLIGQHEQAFDVTWITRQGGLQVALPLDLARWERKRKPRRTTRPDGDRSA